MHINAYLREGGYRFVTSTRYGFKIAGTTRDILQRFLYMFGVWEPNLSAWISGQLKAGDVFVDVGANIGYFSLLASRLVGQDGKVVAVEASPTIFQQLTANVDLNNLGETLRTVNCVASDKLCTIEIFRGPDKGLGRTSAYSEAGFESEGSVPGMPLSFILSAGEIERARLIKIDVEGLEAEVVMGLLPVIREAPQDVVLVVEVGGGPKGSPSASESAARIIPLLTREGFHTYRIENSYNPVSYRNGIALARPKRVFRCQDITSECDLIFSRCDTAVL
jgi:FkbM family methyltransferase